MVVEGHSWLWFWGLVLVGLMRLCEVWFLVRERDADDGEEEEGEKVTLQGAKCDGIAEGECLS